MLRYNNAIIEYGEPVVIAGWGNENEEKNLTEMNMKISQIASSNINKISPIFIAENSNSMDSKLVKGDSGSPVWYFDEENQEFYQVSLLMLI